jgi:hypothetical protein
VNVSALWHYEKLFWNQVWAEVSSSTSKHLGMEGLFALIGFGIGFIAHDQNALTGFVGALATISAVTIGMLAKSLLTASPKLYREQLAAVTTLIREKAILEERLKPKLQLRHGAGGSFMQVDSADGGGVFRVHRIEVHNTSGTTIRNVKVQIEYTGQETSFLPIPITEMNDRPERNDLPKETFDFNPDERRYFTVVFKHEGAEPRFFASYATRRRPNIFEDGLYEFRILVTGDNVSSQRLRLKIWVDEEGRLRMKDADQ